MHTTHLLFLLSALASDYEHSTRPSKKSSGTTNRTNKKKQPKPKPFFCSQKTSTKPCRNSDQLAFSFQLNGNISISIIKTSLLFCAQQVWGRGHWCGKSVFTRTYLCTICTSTIQQFLSKELCHVKPRNGRISEDFLSLDFNSLSQGQHSYVSAARAKTEHWSSETNTCPVICGTSKGSKGMRAHVKATDFFATRRRNDFNPTHGKQRDLRQQDCKDFDKAGRV